MIHIKETFPPNYTEIKAKFNPPVETFYTYGDTIHSPFGLYIPPDIVEHESVHVKQQTERGITPEEWWNRYINDPLFRFNEEKEAYHAQYRYMLEHIKDRNRIYELKRNLATVMSSPMYDGMCTFEEAMAVFK